MGRDFERSATQRVDAEVRLASRRAGGVQMRAPASAVTRLRSCCDPPLESDVPALRNGQ